MASHPLDNQYSQPAGPPHTHRLGSTYDLPSSLVTGCACSMSQRIPLQYLQGRAKGDHQDPMVMERSSSSEGRSSFGINKRSVPGMKSLMPLKLLSPTLPEFNIWPSPEPVKRSTFGTKINSDDLDNSSDIGNRARDSLKSRKRSRHRRDTPIYSQAGSPIPSRAYFSDDDVSFNCSQLGSMNDGDKVIQAILKEYKLGGSNDDDVQADDVQRTPSTIRNLSQKDSALPPPRWSELSFQCSGEAWYMEESAWLRSHMRQHNSIDDHMPEEVEDVFSRRNVESWLGDTSSSFEHEEEILACATAFSPSKARVIALSIHSNHLADMSPPIPARSSSLMETSRAVNNFWNTLGTPPVTPSGPWTGEYDMLSHMNQANKDIHVLPNHILDIPVPSPPQSPHGTPYVATRAAKLSPEKRAAARLPIFDLNSQWPLPPSQVSPPSLLDIVSSLEASTFSFPSDILLPDTPCIAAIRSQEFHHLFSAVPQHQPASPLRSPSGHEFPRPPSFQPTGNLKSFESSTQFQLQHSSPSIISSSPPYRSSEMRSFSLPNLISSCLYPPDLTPLLRIFPQTSDFMRSVLYAHIIAHIFVTSLSDNRKSQKEQPSGRRQDASYRASSPLAPKAANVLGIAFLDADPAEESEERQPQFKVRLEAVQQTLRKCICSLISVMDSNLGIEDVLDLHGNDSGCNDGQLFIRTLEEVVRNCETGVYGLGGMV